MSTLEANSAHAIGRWQSRLARVNSRGRLVYQADASGNQIPDFSHAGYRGGGQEPPELPTVATIRPVDGDNTAHLQAALDAVGVRPKDANGHRGALLLEAGTYRVAGTVRLRHSGVVIRGVGDDEDPATNTVIRATGDTPTHRDVLVVGSGANTQWRGEKPNTRTNVTSDLVNVGQREFDVADGSKFRQGDNVILVHPCTAEWLQAVDGGATGIDEPWSVGSQPITYNRFVTDVDGNHVTVDAPVFNHLDRSLAQTTIHTWDRASLVTESGVENLRIHIEFAGDPDVDEAHAWVAVRLRGLEDGWVRGCTFRHFAKAGVETNETTRVTVSDCRALDPASIITGGLRYNFNTEGFSQHILFQDCYATKARHAFISNGTSGASGIVFLRGTSAGSLASSEGHRRWSQGMLFDNHREVAPAVQITLGLYNRGDYGTGHGWATVHSVAWNCDLAGRTLVVQRPPTGQNYAIGCRGIVTGDGPFDHPTGHIEGANRPGLTPGSLYEAQLAARLRG
ncbi:pectate lyase family protein [Tenggerimyces flavus]|uniref:Peptidoglycan-binding protein n=1 Tax=Tenggerimyces flavus TaxID=1708749 RepID=A0ABV7YEB9_9ACTN|nr:hypothetical protein [Tenggerimyces flavus]MBM7787208.1 hypothetical protein [Tenggerimyces flavus]